MTPEQQAELADAILAATNATCLATAAAQRWTFAHSHNEPELRAAKEATRNAEIAAIQEMWRVFYTIPVQRAVPS